jgi:hypothetical protein
VSCKGENAYAQRIRAPYTAISSVRVLAAEGKVVGGQLIDNAFDLVINTSCEYKNTGLRLIRRTARRISLKRSSSVKP